MEPLISIQILNWNRAQESLRAIESATQQTYSNIEIVFVDNGSTDDSVELVQSRYPNVRIIPLDKNYGCPDGRNRGIEYCKGEFIFYLDNDGVLHRDAVAKAYEVIKQDDSVAVVAGVVYDFDKSSEVDTEIVPQSTKRYLHNNFQGGICLHRKSIYAIIGKYPSHFFYGGEEWYLTCRILDNNFKIIKDESIILWHKRSEIARSRERELMNAYYNKLYVCVSLYPFRYALMFFIYFPIKYYQYARINGFGAEFLKSLFSRYPSTSLSALLDRKPIETKTYKRLKKRDEVY